ncbi:MAG: outer membrane beta-barrel protein [Rhizobiaceae bacterium]
MLLFTKFNNSETMFRYGYQMKKVEFMRMIKNILMAGAIGLSCASAQATELRGSIDSMATGNSNWSGFYIGTGVSYTKYKDKDGRFPGFISSGDDLALSLHAGYNHQVNNFVVGFEADYVNLSSEFKIVPPPFVPLNLEVTNMMSARLRVGYDFDRFMPFATGGVAYAATNIAGLQGYGWVAGGGLEYKVTDHLVFGVQYLHYHFDEFGGDPVTVDADLFNARFSAKF